jgi:RHS repeat-associated protein
VLHGSVGYGSGRFPVTTTDAAGHTQTTIYDPVLGVLLQKIDPNKIATCYAYDKLGRTTSETDRCGSSAPLMTTIRRSVAPPPTDECLVSAENCVARVITVTTPPTGNPNWTFTDDGGRTVETLTGSFEGGLIETRTLHNSLGQVSQTSKPFLSTDQPSFTVTTYDNFNRVSTVTDPLGVIDASGASKSSLIKMTYDGVTIQTDRTLDCQAGTQTNCVTQTKKETKNAIGKLASTSTLTETGFVGVSYAYDADGNVTTTTDPAGNKVLVGYDTRGRKMSTTDPDMGSWSYTEDGFGDLVSQIDPNALQLDPSTKGTTMTYDPLGRMLTKTDSTGTAQWVYDVAPGAGIGKLAAMVSSPDTKLAGACTIPFVTVTDGNRAGKSFTYDQFGDVQQVSECADGATFVSSYEYDALGRQSMVRYPVVKQSQLAVGYHYTSLGYLQYLTDESSDYGVLWQAKAMNAFGQVTDEQTRNGVETVSNRNPLTGWLLGSTATAHADHENLIQNWSYGFDELGNLLARNRADAVNALTSQETFGYDLTNRLTGAQVATSDGQVSNLSYGYDALGNLTQKGGNTYAYGTGAGCAAGPHAVCSVGGGALFTYDADGNMTSSGSRTVTYTPSNKVREIVSEPMPSQGNDTGTVDFMYGADTNRVVQLVSSGVTTARTVYVGLGGTGKSLYEQTTQQTTTGTSITHVNYIYAGGVHGGNAFALRVLADDGSVTATKYYSFDHLGSVTAMSDEDGRVAASGTSATVLAYDAWGARRNPDETAAIPASFSPPIGNREFTGQEQIPDVGLVNMNGRVYDPVFGRFLSPDPNVQDVTDLQSYNRYSYASNNPLRYTDPTGYFLSGLGRSLESRFSNPMFDVEFVTTIAVCATTGPGCAVWSFELAMFNASAAIATGAPFGQTAIDTGIGLGVGFATANLIPAGGPLEQLAVGATSAAVATALSDGFTGRGLGYDVFDAALISAASGAITYGLTQINNVSEASADTAQGERPLYTREEDLGNLFSNEEPANPLDINSSTLDNAVAGTALEGRATMGDLPEGIVGRTNPDGSVTISPEAFRSADALALVIDHEGIHVQQLITGNFAATDLGVDVNELKAWRSTLQFIDARNGVADMDYAWSYAVDQVADYVEAIDYARGGGAYLSNVTGTMPYNYSLLSQDVCPITVCNPAGYKR